MNSIKKKTRKSKVTTNANNVAPQCSINDEVVDLLDDELRPLIRVTKPSRSSLTYERME